MRNELAAFSSEAASQHALLGHYRQVDRLGSLVTGTWAKQR
jgi:hypothetical protein